MDLDSVLKKIGEFGPYQKRLYFLLCLVSVPAAFHNLGYVFWAARPDHWCVVPTPAAGLSPAVAELNESDVKRLSVPWEAARQAASQCRMFDLDYGNLSSSDVQELLSLRNRSGQPTRDCSDWIYDTTQYKSTIVTQWDLVCGRKWLTSTTQSLYMAARIIGTIFFGHMADRFGRRIILLTCTVLQVGISICAALVPEFYSFMVLRSLLAIVATGEFQTAFVIVMEIVGPNWRVFTGTVVMVFWALAYMAMAGLGFLIRDRVTLQLVSAAPMVVLFVYFWVVPESPRWLLTQGRDKEAKAIVRRMAKVNGRELPEELDITIKREEKGGGSVVDLLRTPYVRRMSFVMFYIWFVNSMVYYGLSLNSSSFGGNDYLNFLIAGAVEIPAYLICYVAFTRFGRRWPLSLAMATAGLSLFFTGFIPASIQPARMVFSMLGKGAITCSYSMIYVYTSELYPTFVRSVGVGTCSMLARIGGAIAPFAADLSLYWNELPLLLFGGAAMIACVLSLILPETKGKSLPSTVNESEEMAKGQVFFTCCGRAKNTAGGEQIKDGPVVNDKLLEELEKRNEAKNGEILLKETDALSNNHNAI